VHDASEYEIAQGTIMSRTQLRIGFIGVGNMNFPMAGYHQRKA